MDQRTQHGAAGQLVQLANEGTELVIQANTDATLLVLSGEPIQEPVVGHGPFRDEHPGRNRTSL